ncbi:MAG TPA: MFS transporter [Ilumatobacter sp.]|nr:MFS transporter [Ilumatobacter sp.]
MSSTFRSMHGNRNAKLFFGGLMLSNVGTWIQFTAVAILVDRLTGKTTAIGILTALQFGPLLLMGAWAGVISDRVDRRKMALITQTLLAAQGIAIAALDIAGELTIEWIYVLTLILGIVSAFDNPARRGFVIELVPESQISNVVSLNTAVMTGSRIFGPAITALLIGPLGTGWLFSVNALSFVAIIGSLLLVDTSKLYPPPRLAKGGTPIRDALRYIHSSSALLVTFVVFTVVSTFGFNYSVSVPRIASEIWNSEQWYGWVLTAISVGSLIGSLATAARARVTLRWMAGNGLILGAAGLALAWSPSGWVALAVSLPLGLGGSGFISSMNAITQETCPPDMRGRILALTAVAFLGSYPIGGPITGIIGDTIGLEWSLAYGAIISLVAVLALVWWALGSHPAQSRFEVLGSLLGSSNPLAASPNER